MLKKKRPLKPTTSDSNEYKISVTLRNNPYVGLRKAV